MQIWSAGSSMLVLIATLSGAAAQTPGGATGLTAVQARQVFDRFKQLAGEWDARSTRGWEGTHEIRLIGRGSALLSTSKIEPHPGADEGMATLFHLDRDRLMVTHYCVAGNQPRLVATKLSADGKRVEFEFLDGTNMKSPEAGHMHRAVYLIHSPDQYESRWTFYRDGKESWMENIVNTRKR